MIARPALTRALGVVLLSAAVACTARPDADDMQALSDPMITATIQSKYFVDTTIKGRHIDVDTSAGVVTLAGTVESDAERDRAVSMAQQTEGVVRVDDRLVTQAADTAGAAPPASAAADPAWIATKIEAQYFVDPDVKGRDIDVMATPDGTVRLRGVVDTPQAKERAVVLARETEGVTAVEDELLLKSDMPDAVDDDTTLEAAARDTWITTKIQARYFLDADVKARNIDVSTTDGVVSLTGTVESDAERREAATLARDTDGVRDVRDELRVVAPPSREAEPDASDMPVTDTWLTTKIQAQYFADPDVSGLAIDVTTVNRVVTLAGEVSSPAEKTLAENIARDTEGVRQVQNRLVVQGDR